MAFQKYTGEQVQQLAPGFVEAYGRAGASIGQGIASIGSSVAKGIEGAEQRRIENAKTQGAINPYLRTEVENVNRSVENGFLQVGKDGKVSIVAGQEKNLDPNKIGRAIDLYNQTDGGKKELKTADLAGLVSTIQSYDTLEKQATDRAAAARATKLADLEYNSKYLSSAAALSQGIAGFAAQKRELGRAMNMQGDTAGAQLNLAEAAALTDKSQAVLFDAYRSSGIDVSAYMPAPVTPPPARPAAVAVGSGASTLYTVDDTSAAEMPSASPAQQAILDRFNAGKQGAPAAAAAAPAPAPVPAMAAQAVQVPAPAPQATPAAATPAPAPAKPTAATGRNLMLGTMPKAEAPAAQPAGTTPAAGAVAGQTVTKPAYIEQAETEIASLREQKDIFTKQYKAAQVSRAVSGLLEGDIKYYDKVANDANDQAIKINDSITKKMEALTAEQTRVETGAIATTKLAMEQAKTMDDRLPDFGQGYMAAGRAKAFTLYPEDPGRALTDLRIAGIKGESKEITETIGAIGSFMEGTMSIESAIDARLEEGKGYFDRFTLTSDDYENIAKGNVSEKILLASMRKVIVSGGNFSDADRTFVLEAIASINSVDPTKRNEYFKSLNKVMAGMVFKMYDGKLKSMGVERHLELLSPEDRATAVSDTEKAFKSRFGLDDTNAASGARTELSALIKEAKGNKSFISDRKQAESAVATFIDKAKQERAIAEAAKEPKK